MCVSNLRRDDAKGNGEQWSYSYIHVKSQDCRGDLRPRRSLRVHIKYLQNIAHLGINLHMPPHNLSHIHILHAPLLHRSQTRGTDPAIQSRSSRDDLVQPDHTRQDPIGTGVGIDEATSDNGATGGPFGRSGRGGQGYEVG